MYNFKPIEEFSPEEVVNLSFDYDIAFSFAPVDDRGQYSKEKCFENSKELVDLSYDPEDLCVYFDSSPIRLLDFLADPSGLNFKSLLFDATNLGFAEIAILLRHALLHGNVKKVGFYYVEPIYYKDKFTTPQQVRSFDLSEKVSDIDIIPSFYTHQSSEIPNYLLAFLGFEDVRLSRALNNDEGNDFSELSVAFTVPPFQTGWDTHALMANSLVLETERNLKEAFFVSGNQHIGAYELIRSQKRYSEAEGRSITIAPFGTKPTSIAAALASAEDSSINIIYDFPERKVGRSTGVGKSHHYPIEFNHQGQAGTGAG